MTGVAVVGAAETTRLGVVADLSVIGLHADAALNALADAGLQRSEIDGLATAGEYPPALAAYLGLAPKWIDGTSVGGCSFMLHVRHAAAAIEAGYCHLPLYGLEDLGFCRRGEAKDFIRERNTAPGGELPMNTNGGGLCYMHSGMYGMYALQESVRQLRGTAPAQVPHAKISVCVGVGGMFAAAGIVIFTNEPAALRM